MKSQVTCQRQQVVWWSSGLTVYLRERGPGSIPGVRMRRNRQIFQNDTSARVRARLEPGPLRSSAGSRTFALISKSCKRKPQS